jgi:hypothetical protein
MLRRALVLLGFVSLATTAAAPAFAQSAPLTPRQMLAVIQDFNVPPAWDGVWSSVDSTYLCTGALQNVSSGLDTLCGGKPLVQATQGSVTFDCNGTGDAFSIDVTCTASSDAFPGCTGDITYHVVASRTADHYDAMFTINIHYTGTCGPLTDSCQRTSSHADRIGPAPPAYCATPVESTTWGRVKTIYR